MGKTPRPSGKEIVRFLEKQGFTVVRIRSSHRFMELGQNRTSVPVQGNQTLKIGTFCGILRDKEFRGIRRSLECVSLSHSAATLERCREIKEIRSS